MNEQSPQVALSAASARVGVLERSHERAGIRSSTRGAMPAREWAYQRLKALILAGRFAPAMRLTETRLVNELGISRTPIREALHKLEMEGVIIPRASRGFVAPEESPEEIEELFEIRAVLEGYALRVICGRVTGEILDELTATVDNTDAALRRQSLDEFSQWNTRFHDMLHTLIGEKPRLHKQLVTLRRSALRYRRRSLQRGEGKARTVEGHRKILLALRLGHADLCESVMREHIRQSQEDALQSVTASSP